jgi:RNA polymerase sigma factor (TIGR02999 family)
MTQAQPTSVTPKEFFERCYPELHRIASRLFARERAGHTLQPTALIHEAFVRMQHRTRLDWSDRSRCLLEATRVIQWYLIEHYRAKQTEKRGGLLAKLDLPDLEEVLVDTVCWTAIVERLDVQQALSELGELCLDQASIFELHVFGGLELGEIGELLGLPYDKVRGEWRMARAWMRRRLESTSAAERP